MKLVHIVSLLLVLIGGINWTTVGLMDMNVISSIFGSGGVTTLMYVLVTVATCYHLVPRVMDHIKAS